MSILGEFLVVKELGGGFLIFWFSSQFLIF